MFNHIGSLASRFLTRPSVRIDRAVELLQPFIDERRESLKNDEKVSPDRPVRSPFYLLAFSLLKEHRMTIYSGSC